MVALYLQIPLGMLFTLPTILIFRWMRGRSAWSSNFNLAILFANMALITSHMSIFGAVFFPDIRFLIDLAVTLFMMAYFMMAFHDILYRTVVGGLFKSVGLIVFQFILSIFSIGSLFIIGTLWAWRAGAL